MVRQFRGGSLYRCSSTFSSAASALYFKYWNECATEVRSLRNILLAAGILCQSSPVRDASRVSLQLFWLWGRRCHCPASAPLLWPCQNYAKYLCFCFHYSSKLPSYPLTTSDPLAAYTVRCYFGNLEALEIYQHPALLSVNSMSISCKPSKVR